MTGPEKRQSRRGGGRSIGRLLMFGTLVLAVAAAASLALGTDDARLLRLGIVAALWAALLAAFATVRVRRRAEATAEQIDDLRARYQLELEREVTARKEHERTVEQEITERIEADRAGELEELRAELRGLRESLGALLGGEVLVQRVALRAESARLRSVPDELAAVEISEPSAVAEPTTEVAAAAVVPVTERPRQRYGAAAAAERQVAEPQPTMPRREPPRPGRRIRPVPPPVAAPEPARPAASFDLPVAEEVAAPAARGGRRVRPEPDELDVPTVSVGRRARPEPPAVRPARPVRAERPQPDAWPQPEPPRQPEPRPQPRRDTRPPSPPRVEPRTSRSGEWPRPASEPRVAWESLGSYPAGHGDAGNGATANGNGGSTNGVSGNGSRRYRADEDVLGNGSPRNGSSTTNGAATTGGRRRAPEPADGAHSAGRSVDELLSAYGSGQPRSRHRRDEGQDT